jgi:RNA polymerase sigma-70 factor (ECF subfamily)
LQRSLPISTDNAAVVTDAATTLIDTLFRQYELPICSYLARLTGSVARAQELTQETFIRAYRALLRGEQWDNPRAWLYRVASRLATDDHRRRKLLEWLPLSGEEPDPEPGVEATATNRVAVQAALDALPPKYRFPLVLHVYAGCTVAEIAQTLGLSESGVKSRLSRAREKFRRAYGQEEGE